MNNPEFQHTAGSVTLLAALCMSMLLLMLTVEVCTIGWYTREGVLSQELKQQSVTRAQSCLGVVAAQVLVDPSFSGDATTTDHYGTCYIFPLQFNVPERGMVTVRVRSVVHDSYTVLEAVYDMHDVQVHAAPETVSSNGNENVTVHRRTWREVP